jgi:hypothetical protein
MGRRVFLISVASSLFASIAFAWLLEPIAKGIWHAGSESASVWFVHLQDAAFHNAALGKRDWVSTALFLYLFVFVSSGVAAVFRSDVHCAGHVLSGHIAEKSVEACLQCSV